MGLPDSNQVPRDWSYSGTVTESDSTFAYGTVTLYGSAFQRILLASQFCNSICDGPTTPPAKPTVWAFSFSLAATGEVEFSFFSCGYLDVSVPRVRLVHLCIQCTIIRESRDQRLFDSFPGLIAAFHALHRLLAPRHPPHALSSLTTMIFVSRRPHHACAWRSPL